MSVLCETCHWLAGSCEQSNKITSRWVRNGKYFGQVNDRELYKNNSAARTVVVIIIIIIIIIIIVVVVVVVISALRLNG